MDGAHVQVQWTPELNRQQRAGSRVSMAQNVDGPPVFSHAIHGPAVALIDSLLWDLAGLHAQLPVHKLLGGFRNRVPAYLTETGIPYEDTLKSAQRAVDEGFKGFKDHAMLGVQTNLALAKDLRNLLATRWC